MVVVVVAVAAAVAVWIVIVFVIMIVVGGNGGGSGTRTARRRRIIFTVRFLRTASIPNASKSEERSNAAISKRFWGPEPEV